MTLPLPVRRFARACAAAVLLVPLSGCLVVTLSPVYDTGSVVFDEALLGTWEQAEDRDTLIVGRGAWNAYDLSYQDGADITRFTAYLTRIEGRTVLDVTLEAGVEARPGTVRVHWPMLIDRQGDALSVRLLDYTRFKSQLAERRIESLRAAFDTEQNVVLGADTKALREWLAQHVNDEAAWDAATTFNRRPAAPAAQPPAPVAETEPVVERHEGDDYTRYELLAPETASFKIVYEVTATQTGARYYFNPIRKGSEATDEAVFEQRTGASLPFTVVTGAQAKAAGLVTADPDTQYIQVSLPAPVPTGGETRLRIDKTYKDAASYLREGQQIVFTRSLGIRRNSVVLPPGYELVACNVPSQIVTEPDGRVRVSFMNIGPGPSPLTLKARPLSTTSPKPSAGPAAAAAPPAVPATAAQARPSVSARLAERARQDREIVYFLQQPETHAFALYHDYTERRPGTDKYLNVVRAGSRVSNPSARLLDTGAALKVETLKGDAVTAAGLDIGEPVTPETEVVVIRFPPVEPGHSTRIRIQETYTDEGRYYLDDDELVWDRSLGRAMNAVVLPAGWYLTASSIPAVVSVLDDGRVRLEYNNPRPDELAVLLKARRR